MSTMYISHSGTYDAGTRIGHKIGDAVTESYCARLFAEEMPHDRYILSLNPKFELAFVFDQFIEDFNVEVVYDHWPAYDQELCYHQFDVRRMERKVHDIPFDTYRELYLRVDGGKRQTKLCGEELGLARRNIFDYIVLGQEGRPPVPARVADFRPSAFGWSWNPQGPHRSVFVAPHAVSQGNDVFTAEFWKQTIAALVAMQINVTVCSDAVGSYGTGPLISYYFDKEHNMQNLFRKVSEQRLVLCGNTGISWIAGAHGVPCIVGEPDFFWFLEYRMRECGIPAQIFSEPISAKVASMVQSRLPP